MKRFEIFGWILLAGVIVASMAMVERFVTPTKCVDTAIVDKIVEVKYRDATMLMTDGRTVTLYQPSLRPGDKVCIAWDR